MNPKRRAAHASSRPRPPDPPVEIFKRTKDEERAAFARLEAEVERMKARGVPSTLDDGPIGDEPRPIGDPLEALAELRRRGEIWQEERRSLPCWRAVYPAGVPDGFLDLAPDNASAIKGRAACRDAGTRDDCRYAGEGPTCLWNIAVGNRERAATNLTLGLGKEAEEEHKLVLASHDLDTPARLRDYDPMLVARAWLAGGRRRLTLANAAQLAPLTGEIRSAGAPVAVELSGEERLMIWGGNPGRGKTVAAIWCIARRGGLYILEYQLGRPFDVDHAAGVAGVLVVDQLQPTDPDEKRRAARRLDELAHRRFAAGRKTLILGNVDYPTFASRLGEVAGGQIKHPGIIAERCAQAGSFVLFGGPSLRAT